jgi:hypothetical protein
VVSCSCGAAPRHQHSLPLQTRPNPSSSLAPSPLQPHHPHPLVPPVPLILPVCRPPQAANGQEVAIQSVALHPLHPDQLFVCNRSNTLYLMTMQGQVIKSFSSGKREGGDFAAAVVSPRGGWAYCLGEDNVLYCFDLANSKLEHIMSVSGARGAGGRGATWACNAACVGLREGWDEGSMSTRFCPPDWLQRTSSIALHHTLICAATCCCTPGAREGCHRPGAPPAPQHPGHLGIRRAAAAVDCHIGWIQCKPQICGHNTSQVAGDSAPHRRQGPDPGSPTACPTSTLPTPAACAIRHPAPQQQHAFSQTHQALQYSKPQKKSWLRALSTLLYTGTSTR